MCDLCTAIKPYRLDPPLERENLTKPPRRLLLGERWDGTDILYSAGWLNDLGEIVPFGRGDERAVH